MELSPPAACLPDVHCQDEEGARAAVLADFDVSPEASDGVEVSRPLAGLGLSDEPGAVGRAATVPVWPEPWEPTPRAEPSQDG